MPDLQTLKPKDHAEEIAIFRSEIIGALTRRELDHGELRAAFVALSSERYRPPKAHGTRQYAVSTLERWYYRYREGGLEALRPVRRDDDRLYLEVFAQAQRPKAAVARKR